MKNNKIVITLIIILIIIYLLYYLESNTSYSLINHIPPYRKSTLYIVSHDYEHKDIFIILNLFGKRKEIFYILFEDKIWNRLLNYTKPKNLIFIFRKGNTVNLLSQKLKSGYNVIMFLYKEIVVTGPYYILKNTSSNLILINIKSTNNKKNLNHFQLSIPMIYYQNLFNKFYVQFKKINYNSNIFDQEPKNFVDLIKNNLYK